MRWQPRGARRAVRVGATCWLLATVAVEALAAEPSSTETRAEVRAENRSPARSVPSIPFTDVTRDAGIDFVHQDGATGAKLLPETMGGGVALFDYDGDGDADLLLVDTSGLRLYRNDSTAGSHGSRLRFTDVTQAMGLAEIRADGVFGMGVAVGDIDADGDLDIFLTAAGPDRLLRNEGDRFTDVSVAAGVAGGAEDWSTGAAFFDADGDGDLDLIVVRYLEWSPALDRALDFRIEGIGRAYARPQDFGGARPALFLNRGDGTFVDATESSGLVVADPVTGAPSAKALAVLPVDVDGDGRIDVLVANDTVRNFFFRNLGKLGDRGSRSPVAFEEAGEFFGLAYDRDGRATGAMGVDAGYYRNDVNLGFVVGNFAGETSSVLRAQDDPEFFIDEAIQEGLGAATRALLTFGVFFFDADLDGRLDILQVNGHVEPDIAKSDPVQSYPQPGQLFWNSGEGFDLLPAAKVGALADSIAGRGAAYADLDGDGDLDVVLTQIGGSPKVLRNDQELGHHWLRVRLEPSHRAVGAWIELAAADVVQRRHVMPTRSYLSQVEPVATFGLGTSSEVEALTVTWPDGTRQTVAVEAADRLLVVEAPR